MISWVGLVKQLCQNFNSFPWMQWLWKIEFCSQGRFPFFLILVTTTVYLYFPILINFCIRNLHIAGDKKSFDDDQVLQIFNLKYVSASFDTKSVIHWNGGKKEIITG